MLGQGSLDAFLDAIRRAAPGVDVSIEPATAVVPDAADASTIRRPIRCDGRAYGTLVVRGPAQGGFVESAVAGLELALRSATAAPPAEVVPGADAGAPARGGPSPEATAERERRDHELALGRRIQLSLLPNALPRADGWEIGAAYEAAREVGGDFYDVFPVRGRRGSIALVIADVTGKGIPAALMMAFARPLIRAAADHSRDTVETLERVNRVLVDERRSALFITALHLRLHLRSGLLTWSAAGHEPPLLVPGSGARTRRLPAGGTLLGAFRALGAREHALVLAPGDLVVAYTDGVTDARRADGERFGDARLTRAARAAAGLPGNAAAESIRDAVHRFTSGAPAADDLAVLTLRRLPRRPRRRPARHPGAP